MRFCYLCINSDAIEVSIIGSTYYESVLTNYPNQSNLANLENNARVVATNAHVPCICMSVS